MEQKIVRALPDMMEHSTDPQLATAFRNHLEETRGHASKVESLVAKHTGENSTETCKVIGGLTKEASDTIKDVTNADVRDIALIGAAQQVEHHEIAVYGTLRNWALVLGLAEDASVPKSIESEELKADQLLTQRSESHNSVAV